LRKRQREDEENGDICRPAPSFAQTEFAEGRKTVNCCCGIFAKLLPSRVRCADDIARPSMFPFVATLIAYLRQTRKATLVIGVMFSLSWSFGFAAPTPVVSREKLEAVYLLNFGRFVQWPKEDFPSDDAPLTIGIVGRDPFGTLLDEVVRGEKIEQHPIVVRRFPSIAELGNCHILYVGDSERDRLERLFERLGDSHVLTVSGIADFAGRGGIVQFVQDRDRVRFRINLRRAKRSALELSAKLLRPAEVISHSSAAKYARNSGQWPNLPCPERICTLRLIQAKSSSSRKTPAFSGRGNDTGDTVTPTASEDEKVISNGARSGRLAQRARAIEPKPWQIERHFWRSGS
jgi:hypothetical protein